VTGTGEGQTISDTTTTARNVGGVAAVVLAAGKSTRMKSKTPKALHPVCGKPILAHLLDALTEAGAARRVVVVGYQADAVRAALDARYGPAAIEYAEQIEQKGTGHAALMTEPVLAAHTGTVLILPGDAPLLSAAALRGLIETHHARRAAATLLTAVLPYDAGSYGRVLRDASGNVAGIVEARDATPEQLAVREINTSVYAFDSPALFRCLRDLRPDNAQGELYLTDVVGLLRAAGQTVAAVVSPDPDVVLGVNTRVELAEVAAKMRARLLRDLMLSGVTVEDPQTVYVEAGVTVGQDTTLLPYTHLLAGTVVGEDCVIGPHAHLSNARLGDRVRARACFIEDADVADDVKIGPFAHIRPGSRLDRKVRIGNFVETKAAHLHEDVAAGHLTYLGDAEIGAHTNIGAGTITCNYDGYRKHRTTVGENVFVGSHTALVAPVTVGDGAATAAGSVITGDVPAGDLGIARERQTNKTGWAEARRRSRQSQEQTGS
jgi:bifunctional UDP-N-acetylglucosamine pyrophosphorylase/glucosamine-1-phosphate N-acetyltransferase